MMYHAIAIDGPSGAGKSTLARELSKELKFIYIDTGAMYRAIGLYVAGKGVASNDREKVPALLPEIQLELCFIDGVQHILVNGQDVSDEIRTESASRWASDVSAMPAVRAFLLDFQRRLAREHSVVMDGRDIGTVVLPDADVKIFLTAAPEARAKRRLLELEQRGQQADFDTILHDIIQRDEQDRNRPIAPLRQAEDAVLLDTTHLNLEESLLSLLTLIKEGTAQ